MTKNTTEDEKRLQEETSKIIIAKQSYNAKNIHSLGELELIGLIEGSGHGIKDANRKLKEKAHEIGATYVFGVDYKQYRGSYRSDDLFIAYGDAYKPK